MSNQIKLPRYDIIWAGIVLDDNNLLDDLDRIQEAAEIKLNRVRQLLLEGYFLRLSKYNGLYLKKGNQIRELHQWAVDLFIVFTYEENDTPWRCKLR